MKGILILKDSMLKILGIIIDNSGILCIGDDLIKYSWVGMRKI